MEINELKNLWEMENESLKSRIQMNEKVIADMKLDSATNTFKFFLNISMAGRNLALVYALISFIVAIVFINQLQYSIPIIIGGCLMLWSFYHHLTIEKFKNYHEVSIIELQKSIEKFRIHSVKSKHFDLLVVIIWLLSLAPLYLRYLFNLDIYESPENLLAIDLIIVGVIAFVILISIFGYNMYDRKLKNSEAKLSEIMAFEQE